MMKFLIGSGSDEVGVGDYLAPIVVVATFVSPTHHQQLQHLDINDSKKLSDTKIRQIAPILLQTLPYSVQILDNAKYNEIYQKYPNINQIKAILHNHAFHTLQNKTDISQYPAYVDQFTPLSNYQRHLQRAHQDFYPVILDTKAESKYFPVACASIMARYIFLQQCDLLSQKLNTTILKGASSQVDQQVKVLIKIHGEHFIDQYCKKHFVNTHRICPHLKK